MYDDRCLFATQIPAKRIGVMFVQHSKRLRYSNSSLVVNGWSASFIRNQKVYHKFSKANN